jgi:hypothetical protein
MPISSALNGTDMLRVYSETTVKSSSSTTSLDTTFTNPTPKCTIAPSKCTALWQTYLTEHGMPTTFENATELAITPVPTDRPRCSVGNVTNICKPTPTPSCVLIASKVDLYVSVPSQPLPAWEQRTDVHPVLALNYGSPECISCNDKLE